MRPQLGSLIGANGGLVFVLVNAGSLPGPAAVALRVLAAVGFVAMAVFAVTPAPEVTSPSPWCQGAAERPPW